jgi:hypothetical protein
MRSRRLSEVNQEQHALARRNYRALALHQIAALTNG